MQSKQTPEHKLAATEQTDGRNCRKKLSLPKQQNQLKDVRAKIFHSMDFFTSVLQSDKELLVPEMKNIGGQRLRFRYKACGKLPWFWLMAHVIQHGLQWFIVKNIEGELTEADDLSLIL